MEQNKKIGKLIREARKGKRWSQQELAARLGVSRNSIINWESGRNRPEMSQLMQISRQLEITPRELLQMEEAGMTMEERRLLTDIRHLTPDDRRVIEKLVIFLLEKTEIKGSSVEELRKQYRMLICYRMGEDDAVPGYCFIADGPDVQHADAAAYLGRDANQLVLVRYDGKAEEPAIYVGKNGIYLDKGEPEGAIQLGYYIRMVEEKELPDDTKRMGLEEAYQEEISMFR